MAWVFFILAAGVGAVFVGLIGTGSSLIILPTLATVFPSMFAPDVALRLAAGTTLAIMAIGAFSASIAQMRRGYVCWPLLRLSVAPYFIGAVLGPWIARFLEVDVLRLYIAAMLAVVGLWSLRPARHTPVQPMDWVARRLQIALVLAVIGIASSAAGVASGIFAIPFLSRFNLSLRTVIGTCTVGATLYSTFGTLGYVTSGWGTPGLPAYSIGFVYLPVLAVMGATGALMSPVGVRLAGRVNDRALRYLLTGFVLVAAVAVVLR